ncbi:MAG TPA: glutathione S-transferase C-terminal domain-containing protein [Halioglobus sp.]
MKYIPVEQAINAPGLRLVLSAGVPGPWGEAAKAILAYKQLDYTPVYQQGGGENAALRDWTGQTSAPVAVYEDLPPACHWLDVLMLAERLAPAKPLVPQDCSDRIEVLGLSALIAGVDGFGWHRRLQMLAPMLTLAEPPAMIVRLGAKYGWSPQAHAAAPARLQAISEELDRRLAQQRAGGSDYFVGTKPSAADFYWANFAAMLKPLPHKDNPMPDYMRASYESSDADTLACLTPLLEAHRDLMYQRHIALPLDF